VEPIVIVQPPREAVQEPRPAPRRRCPHGGTRPRQANPEVERRIEIYAARAAAGLPIFESEARNVEIDAA
jgi:hypothetical protein